MPPARSHIHLPLVLALCACAPASPDRQPTRPLVQGPGGSMPPVAGQRGPVVPPGTPDTGTTPPGDPRLPPLPPPAAPACPGQGAYLFEDVATCAGLAEALHIQVAVPSMTNRYGTAQAFADLDNDGWLDAVIAGPTGWNRVFLGSSDGSFTVRSEPDLEGLPADSLLAADFDDDGFKDLFLASAQDSTLVGGPAGFELVEGPLTLQNTLAASVADVDGDGVIELYTADHDCPDCADPEPCLRTADHFWVQGPAGWEDHSAQAFPDYPVRNCGLAFVGQWADWDNDGDADLFIANDRGLQGLVPGLERATPRNTSWRNLGPGCGSACFEEVGEVDGTAGYMNAMGTAAGDYDNDGDLDLAVSDTGPTRLFRNDGTGQFEDVTDQVGLDTMAFVDGWHVAWLDHDNDGDLDLFTARTGQNALYENDGGQFVDISDQVRAATGPHRGAAAVDYDRDGKVDLLVGASGAAWQLLRNTADTQNHWVGLRLVGSGAGGRDALGARVHVTDTSGRVQLREVGVGSTGASGSDLGVHFGLGAETLDTVVITWPDQTVQQVALYEDAWTVVTKP